MALISSSEKNYIPFLPDEVRAVLCAGKTSSLPRPLQELIVEYVNDVLFGPEHWGTFWGVTPVTLPSLQALRKRVTDSGQQTPKPIKEMSVEECANFIGELGKEEHPVPPQKLRDCLNRPVRPEGKLAGLSCAVTYIPSYVRKEGKVMAVTPRRLAEFGLKPKRGHMATFTSASFAIDYVLKREDADSTKPPCYFVMELDLAPKTRGKKPIDAILEINRPEDRSWDVPEARNFIATVFSRRVWKGEVHLGSDPLTFVYGKERSRHGLPLIFAFSQVGLDIIGSDFAALDRRGASGSRKFPLQVQRPGEK